MCSRRRNDNTELIGIYDHGLIAKPSAKTDLGTWFNSWEWSKKLACKISKSFFT